VNLNLPEWELVSGLGCGRFSTVYLGKKTAGPEMAVKIFGNGYEDMCQNELVTLNLFKSAGRPNVPIVQEELRNGKFRALAVLPIGIPVLPASDFITAGMLEQVLAALEFAHQNNIVHRDVKPENIFLDQTDHSKIILNDWSSAARIGVMSPYQGTPLYGERFCHSHIPSPELDLRCFVKTAFTLSTQRPPAVEGLLLPAHFLLN
jgi:serine/threonine protein kinase